MADEQEPLPKRIHLRVCGRVQGVCYRAHTHEKAHALKLTGWVQNLPNGDVEILAEGTPEALDQLLSFCHRGPPAAEVDEVLVSWAEASAEFSGFSIRR